MLLAGFLVTITSLLSFPQSRSIVSGTSCWRNTLCRGPASPTWSGTWDKNNYSPGSRDVAPTSIILENSQEPYDVTDKVILQANESVIYDFGKLVGGVITLTYNGNGTGQLGLAFTEAKNWTGEWSDSSNGSFRPDGAVLVDIKEGRQNVYTQPDDFTRGGFRYLTLFTRSTDSSQLLEITDVSLEISFQPDWSNLRAYRGYFHSSDDLLNKVWYSGAYTLQTNAIPPSQGRAWPILGGSWANHMDLNYGSTDPVIYVDGSKRDRTVWAGDLAIAVPSILVSTGDWPGVRNTLQVMYNDQRWSGELPFAGPAINTFNSDTYHCATLIGTYDYFFFTNDRKWLWDVWRKYKLAMQYILAKIDDTNMLYVTGWEDWGRVRQGGRNTEANMLMYHTLITGSKLAAWIGDPYLAQTWGDLAVKLKAAVNKNNFDFKVGAFKESDIDGSIHPEDGNSMALFFDGALNTSYSSISKQLTTNWISIGAVAPELPNNLVGLIQSFEVKGHFAVRQASRALDLTRRAWGWYLNHPSGTASTCIEGYLADGSFGYRSVYGYGNDYSYTSHAHGWSTGPTDALTSYVVGLQFVSPGGGDWKLSPQFGDLTSAEGGFVTPDFAGNGEGKFWAKWKLEVGTGYVLEWDVPRGTKGKVILPGKPGFEGIHGQQPSAWVVDGGRRMESKSDKGVIIDEQSGGVIIESSGGKHTVRVMF